MDQSFDPTFLSAARAHKALVAIAALTGMLVALVLGVAVLNESVSTSSVLVEDPEGSGLFEQVAGRDPTRYVADQVAILESAGIARNAADIVGGELAELPAQEIQELMHVSSNPESGLIEISAVHDDAVTAIALANAIVEAYADAREFGTASAFARAINELDASIEAVESELTTLDTQILAVTTRGDAEFEELVLQFVDSPNMSQEQLARLLQELQAVQLIRSVESQRSSIVALLQERTQTFDRHAQLVTRRDQMVIDSALASSGIVISSDAEMAERSMGFGRLAAMGLLLGLGVGVSLAYGRSRRARRFEHRFEPEQVMHAPLLAEVPDFASEGLDSSLPVRDAPLSAAAEAFRFAGAAISDRVELSDVRVEESNSGSRIIAVTSPMVGDGKTVTSANLGAALATKGRRVLLLDADFGSQALTNLMTEHKGWHPGLTDMVEVGISLATAIRSIHVGDGLTVDLLSRGSQSIAAPEFFRREEVANLFNEIRESYDIILMDVPPLLQVAYAGTVVRLCDAAVVVVSHGGDVSSLSETANRLRLMGMEIRGYVYNRAPLREEMSVRQGSMRDPLGLGLSSDFN